MLGFAPKKLAFVESTVAAIETLPDRGVLSLEDVSWNEYEDLLRVVDGTTNLRISYDGGRLEIMTTSDWHDYYARLINSLVSVLTEELELDYVSFGSATIKLEKKLKGTEPDDCFYITNAAKVIGKSGLDLTTDPAPDLAIEVDVWHKSTGKFPIYAALGVPEIWRYRKNKMHFYRLEGDKYVETPASTLFPFLTPNRLEAILKEDYIQDFNRVKRAFRQWVRENRPE